MQRQEIFNILRKYNSGTATDYEIDLIETWYFQLEDQRLDHLSDNERLEDLERIRKSLPVNISKSRSVQLWYRLGSVAAALIFLTLGVYFYSSHLQAEQVTVISEIANATKPGGNKAILILDDGRRVTLTGAGNGQLTKQANAEITKTAKGKIRYQVYQPASANSHLVFNTMITPNGGTYELTLSDGTKVILDAGSSIHYPVSFNSMVRNVEITGQAYFEVAPDKRRPFRVSSRGQTVEVLGTHFNVNAYPDEKEVQTTLLEGSVKISNAGSSALLMPGQQSRISGENGKIKVAEADTETAIAWKEGAFRFKRASLQAVLRQFSRWYNVEIAYEGEVPNLAITGKVLRNENAGHVLEILRNLGVKFRKEGKKIIVL